MKIKLTVFLSLFVFLLYACSSSQETTESEESTESQPEVYVFDDITDGEEDTTQVTEDTLPIVPEKEISEIQYFVQVGAFTTRERAEQFYKNNSSKISYQMNISYSDEVNLYVVRLQAFSNRSEAEKVRNELWQTATFKDAFIVTK